MTRTDLLTCVLPASDVQGSVSIISIVLLIIVIILAILTACVGHMMYSNSRPGTRTKARMAQPRSDVANHVA